MPPRRREWGPVERATRAAVVTLAIDPGSDAGRVALAVAAFTDERRHGLPELSPLQVARRSGVPTNRTPAALDSLVDAGLLTALPSSHRPEARRLRLIVKSHTRKDHLR